MVVMVTLDCVYFVHLFILPLEDLKEVTKLKTCYTSFCLPCFLRQPLFFQWWSKFSWKIFSWYKSSPSGFCSLPSDALVRYNPLSLVPFLRFPQRVHPRIKYRCVCREGECCCQLHHPTIRCHACRYPSILNQSQSYSFDFYEKKHPYTARRTCWLKAWEDTNPLCVLLYRFYCWLLLSRKSVEILGEKREAVCDFLFEGNWFCFNSSVNVLKGFCCRILIKSINRK